MERGTVVLLVILVAAVVGVGVFVAFRQTTKTPPPPPPPPPPDLLPEAVKAAFKTLCSLSIVLPPQIQTIAAVICAWVQKGYQLECCECKTTVS